jgi:hypothetical protein
MDYEERLEWLDQEYLSHYDRITVNSEIKMQKGFSSTRELTAFYSLGEEEDAKDNTYLSFNTVIGESLNKELGLSFQILDYVLLQAPGAPVKQALLDAGIGKDILSGYEDEILQPLFTVIAKNSEESKKDEFIGIIRDVLSKLIGNLHGNAGHDIALYVRKGCGKQIKSDQQQDMACDIFKVGQQTGMCRVGNQTFKKLGGNLAENFGPEYGKCRRAGRQN